MNETSYCWSSESYESCPLSHLETFGFSIWASPKLLLGNMSIIMGSPFLLGIVLSFAKRIDVFNWTPKSVFQLKAISIKYNWIWMWCYFTFSWVSNLWYSIEPYSIEPIKLSFNWMQIMLSQIFLTIPCNCAPWYLLAKLGVVRSRPGNHSNGLYTCLGCPKKNLSPIGPCPAYSAQI